MKKTTTFIFLLMMATSLLANNISVTNASLSGQNTSAGVNDAANYTMIKFDISWEHTWRISTHNITGDAAWIFVKYRVGSGVWKHATLSTSDFVEPSGSTITPTADGIGAFMYRSMDGTGSNNWIDAKLRWNYGVDGVYDNDVIDIHVYAIEMVYVSGGGFYSGYRRN